MSGSTFRAFLEVVSFEWRKRQRRILTYVHAVSFFAVGLLFMASAAGFFSSTNVTHAGKVFVNGPHALFMSVTILGYLSSIVLGAVMGQAVHQDQEHKMSALVMTTSLPKPAYYFGRYVGAALYMAGLYTLAVLGLLVGQFLPGLEASRLTSVQLAWLLQPLCVMLFGHLLALGPLFFVGAALTKKILPVYLSSIVLFVGYNVAQALTRDLDSRSLAALLDPFGMSAATFDTQYWSVAEKNTQAIALSGKILANRLLWWAIGAVALVVGYFAFSFRDAPVQAPRSRKTTKTADALAIDLAKITLSPGRISARDLATLSWLECKQAFRNIYFLLIVLAGVAMVLANASVLDKMYGTPTYPVTASVLRVVAGLFGVFIFILMTFYSGELVWKERQAKTDQILDALPVPTWVAPFTKAVALYLMLQLLLVVVMVLGLSIQLAKGYTNFELPLYLVDLFVVSSAGFVPFIGLTLAFQVWSRHKFAAHAALVAFYLLEAVLDKFGFEHPLFSYATVPTYEYSDMNGYGPFVQPIFWFNAFWWGVSFALLALVVANWPRGTNERARLSWPKGTSQKLLVGSVVLAIAAGAMILYNTLVLNAFYTSEEELELSAMYEKKYKAREDNPLPTPISAHYEVELYPSERRAVIGGKFELQNKTQAPIQTIDLNSSQGIEHNEYVFSRPTKRVLLDTELDYATYEFETPLLPNETVSLDFRVFHQAKGFGAKNQKTELAGNGMFLNNGMGVGIGYNKHSEISDEEQRKKRGLKERPSMHPIDEKRWWQLPYISGGGWVATSVHISTDGDQTPIAPGDIEADWEENGRRHRRYKVQGKSLNFVSFLSGRFTERKSRVGEVEVSIFHHPTHTYALDRMERSVAATLDYAQKAFGPYQHQRVRIVEFPRYETFAQSFPSTIPFSESIGFVARVNDQDPKSIDYPFYITAHEVAHQWWGHQVVGADVQGATVLSETLAQYTALMVMKHTYGDEKIGNYLRHELDKYLQGRASEKKQELPLLLVENQGYIHYQKGSLVMFEAQALLGEERVNQAISRMLQKWKQKGPPYPTAHALYDELLVGATSEQRARLEDAFLHITLFDHRALSAKGTQEKDGTYRIELALASRRFYVTGLGDETDQPLNVELEVGLKAGEGEVVERSVHRITQHNTTVVLTSAKKPSAVVLDPRHLLIDRRIDDNTATVDWQ